MAFFEEGLEWARETLQDPDATAVAASGMAAKDLATLFAAFAEPDDVNSE